MIYNGIDYDTSVDYLKHPNRPFSKEKYNASKVFYNQLVEDGKHGNFKYLEDSLRNLSRKRYAVTKEAYIAEQNRKKTTGNLVSIAQASYEKYDRKAENYISSRSNVSLENLNSDIWGDGTILGNIQNKIEILTGATNTNLIKYLDRCYDKNLTPLLNRTDFARIMAQISICEGIRINTKLPHGGAAIIANHYVDITAPLHSIDKPSSEYAKTITADLDKYFVEVCNHLDASNKSPLLFSPAYLAGHMGQSLKLHPEIHYFNALKGVTLQECTNENDIIDSLSKIDTTLNNIGMGGRYYAGSNTADMNPAVVLLKHKLNKELSDFELAQLRDQLKRDYIDAVTKFELRLKDKNWDPLSYTGDPFDYHFQSSNQHILNSSALTGVDKEIFDEMMEIKEKIYARNLEAYFRYSGEITMDQVYSKCEEFIVQKNLVRHEFTPNDEMIGSTAGAVFIPVINKDVKDNDKLNERMLIEFPELFVKMNNAIPYNPEVTADDFKNMFDEFRGVVTWDFLSECTEPMVVKESKDSITTESLLENFKENKMNGIDIRTGFANIDLTSDQILKMAVKIPFTDNPDEEYKFIDEFIKNNKDSKDDCFAYNIKHTDKGFEISTIKTKEEYENSLNLDENSFSIKKCDLLMGSLRVKRGDFIASEIGVLSFDDGIERNDLAKKYLELSQLIDFNFDTKHIDHFRGTDKHPKELYDKYCENTASTYFVDTYQPQELTADNIRRHLAISITANKILERNKNIDFSFNNGTIRNKVANFTIKGEEYHKQFLKDVDDISLRYDPQRESKLKALEEAKVQRMREQAETLKQEKEEIAQKNNHVKLEEITVKKDLSILDKLKNNKISDTSDYEM